MDPDAALVDIQSFLLDADDEGALERCAALYGWLMKEGFEPNWSKANKATLGFWLGYSTSRMIRRMRMGKPSVRWD